MTRQKKIDPETAFDRALGLRLRDMRMASGIKTAAIAERLHRTSGHLYRYENGEVPVTAALLVSYAKVFGCRASELIDGLKVGK